MTNEESKVSTAISKVEGASDRLESAVEVYAWLAYAGTIIVALAGIFTGWNWLLIGYAGSAALAIWLISSFARLQVAKGNLAAATARAESAARNSTN